ncbi:diguanylate cyclase [Pseudoxanthomonas putridarboris]|uniref:diguanylate cyclase n=1 Tax=Pseudoxanthomonas putridarboris TaxID=752605 RepID=A0ABU9IZZ4_9GAMM
MPLSPPLPVLLPASLLLTLLFWLLPARAAAASEPAASPHEEQVSRCLKLRRDEPATAAALAESLLATPGLAVEDELKTLSCLGIAAGLLGEDARATQAAARMERRVRANPQLPAEFRLRAYSQAGSVYHGAGHIHRAEAAYLQAYAISHQLDEREAALIQAATLTNVGLIHSDYLDSPDVADGYYRKALAAAESVGLEDPLILHNHVLNLVKLGRDAEALAAIDEGEAMALRKDSLSVLQRLRGERAGIWIRQGQWARARPLLETVVRAQEASADRPALAGSLAKLSTLQRLTGEPLPALRTAERAWRLVEGTPQPQKQREVLLAWIGAQAALGQAEEALQTGQRLHAIEMHALKQQRLELLADLQARSANASAQRELERLRHEAQIRTLNDEKSRLIRHAGAALLTLLVIAGIAFGLLQRRKNRQLRAVSATDLLTGLKNRRAATHSLQEMATQRNLPGMRHALFLIDIDHFKQVNDTHGHHAGDEVLVELSRRLRDACRPGDLVARWGGEEFLVACPDLQPAEACTVAARLHAAMGCTLELSPGQPWPLTVSLGFAPFPFFDGRDDSAGAGWDYAIRMADRALYAAKDHRDAWAGLWGLALPAGVRADALLEQPEQAVRDGTIDFMASHPLERRPV